VLHPPKGVTPSKLFRLLLQVPRPTALLRVRLDVDMSRELYARALHPLEWAEVFDAKGGAERRQMLIAQALCDRNGRRMFQPGDVEHLTSAEFVRLYAETNRVLGVIGPNDRLSDRGAWVATLKAGARDNLSVSRSLGNCFESYKLAPHFCPERYFGIPRNELLDGHWMAFDACLSLVADDIKHARRK
jgi:hypothetical protein